MFVDTLTLLRVGVVTVAQSAGRFAVDTAERTHCVDARLPLAVAVVQSFGALVHVCIKAYSLIHYLTCVWGHSQSSERKPALCCH